jgi:hypothetical protein
MCGQNPNIGYQECNSLQTPERSKKSLCHSTPHSAGGPIPTPGTLARRRLAACAAAAGRRAGGVPGGAGRNGR